MYGSREAGYQLAHVAVRSGLTLRLATSIIPEEL